MKTTHQLIVSGDRYEFDFRLCTYKNGWAQVDSRQDAPYYGNWVNPTKRQLVSYCEGDLDVRTADTDEEFAAAVRETCDWLKDHTGMGAIDPGFSPDMKADFERLGLGDLLH